MDVCATEMSVAVACSLELALDVCWAAAPKATARAGFGMGGARSCDSLIAMTGRTSERILTM